MAKALDRKDYNFHISRKWHNVYKSLCKTGNRSDLFEKFTSLYTFCVSIGYTKNKFIPLEESFPLFEIDYVNQETEWPVLLAIAWKKNNESLDIFSNMREIIQISDQYAEGGMQYLVDQYLDDHLDPETKYLINTNESELEYNLALFIQEMKEENILI